jgi:phosphatidate cytidylyltransferase
MFLQRLLTAVVAIPIVLSIIVYGGDLGFFLLILFVVAVALWEYLTFIYPQKVNIQIITHTLLGLLLPVSFYLGYPDLVAPTVAFILVFTTAFALFRVTDPQQKAENLFIRLFGIFYVGFLLSYLIALRALPHGVEWIVLAVAINFGTDAGAYFGGRLFGRHLLYPAVSPKKTVEGAIGGIVFCVLIVIACRYVFMKELEPIDILVLSLIGGTLAILGDTAESLIKRGFKVKDAGGILPGHGGFLDRIDSFVFSSPFIYYYAAYFFGS